jgi:hypothetical protein
MENKGTSWRILIGGGGTLVGVDTLRYRDVKELEKLGQILKLCI